MKYSYILYRTHTQTHTIFKIKLTLTRAQQRLTNSSEIALPAKFSSCKLKTLKPAGGPQQTPPESQAILHLELEVTGGDRQECLSNPPLLLYREATTKSGWLVVPLQLEVID